MGDSGGILFTQGVLLEVNSHSACNRIGDHQGRGSEVVGTHTVTQAAFKVLVARQNTTCHQVALKQKVSSTSVREVADLFCEEGQEQFLLRL